MKPKHRQNDQSDIDLDRRHALALIGAAGAASLMGCQLEMAGEDDVGGMDGGTGSGSCVVTPEATEGPYFVDEMLNRSDIRSDPTDGSIQDGVPLRLRMTVSRVNGGVCTALSGAVVDIWHCNADGAYSDVAANGTVGRKFLRGFQVTDADGLVEFTTIYPGWYRGRTVHIHFKVRAESLEFTSQLYFDESITAEVYAESPYGDRGLPDTTNTQDGIFNEETLLALTPDADGYLGTFDIGLRID